MTAVLRRPFGDTRGGGSCEGKGRDGTGAAANQGRLRNGRSQQKLGERQGRVLPQSLQREAGPATPQCQTSGLQNCGTN